MNRRELLIAAPLLAAAPKKKQAEPDVSPAEDLMREHGILRRVLLVYEACAHRLDTGRPPPELAAAAAIVRDFVEGYHEKLEEEQLFPRMEKGPHAELVKTLRAQHEAGRKITAALLGGLERSATRDAIAKFIRMYRPHASREDTVLFPAFHALYPDKQFDALGDKFEELEHKLLKGSSAEKVLQTVEQLEKSLGIYELAQFTPA